MFPPSKKLIHGCSKKHILNHSSSSSTDAPSGCLRFFLSHSSSSSKPSSKTNSPPILRPKKLKPKPKSAFKGNPLPSKIKLKNNSPCWNKPTSNQDHDFVNQQHSSVRVVNNECQLNSYSDDLNFTPLPKMDITSPLDSAVDKATLRVEISHIETGNYSDTKSKTPPVEASISPEIQCASSVVTPVCYGAGYVVSGVSDKRKCRPRGILVVGDNSYISKVKSIEKFDDQDDDNINIARLTTDSVSSKVPSPIEASMNWLLSPCNEEDENRKADSESLGGSIALHSLPSPLSVDELPPTIDGCSNIQLATDGRKNSAFSISSSNLPEFQGFLESLSIQDLIASSPTCTPNCRDVIAEKGGEQRYQLNGENSPFSMDSLGSENVIRTPQSDSSSARKVCSPWLFADSGEKLDFNSMSEFLSLANLSPGSPKALMSSTDLSFRFDCLATMSNSLDLNQFQKILDDRAFWHCDSSSEDVLKSQMRVSWREGLMSRIYEMDEFDSCRCLSDEEEAIDSCSIDLSDILKTPLDHNDCVADPIVTNIYGSPSKSVDDEPEAFEKCEDTLSHQKPCSCAESISTDGGGLAASGDSDWNLCYKNREYHHLPELPISRVHMFK